MDNIVQGTEEWFAARRGKVSASRISDVMAKTKMGYSATRANYMSELITEILTGKTVERFTSADMDWGIKTEEEAANAYAFFTGNPVEKVGFVDHPEIAQSGASPDRLIGEDGLLEIKCPKTSTHLNTLLMGEIDRKYILQMEWQMACTRRKYCDFVSYDPRLPEHLCLFVKRVERDEEMISEICMEVRAFLAELTSNLKALEERFREAS